MNVCGQVVEILLLRLSCTGAGCHSESKVEVEVSWT